VPPPKTGPDGLVRSMRVGGEPPLADPGRQDSLTSRIGQGERLPG
jgi:hypothetical protein